MRILKQLFIIFILCLVGEGIAVYLPFEFPVSVISLLLLLLLLCFKFIKSEMIKDVSEFLLNNMAFFFLPAGVAIIDNFGLVKDIFFILIFICLVTTFLTFAVTAYTVIGITKLRNKIEKRSK